MAAHWCNTPGTWPSDGKPSRRRHSDTHLLVNPINRIPKIELTRQHSLPDSHSKQLDKIFESAALDATHDDDDEWLQEAGIHSKFVHKMDANSTQNLGENIQLRQSEKKGLYSRRSSQHFGMFDKASTTLYSSDPDIYSGQAHLGYSGLPTGQLNLHDLTADLEEHDHEHDSNRGTQTPSKIINIFSTVVPSFHNQTRKSKKGLRLTRKHSLDSHLISTKKQQNSRSAESKRAIKISGPDHLSAMYISGVDTLGGIPENEDSQRMHRIHLLSRLSGLYLELDPQGTLSRGSSCPVIFEGEESDESFDAENQPQLSSSLDRDSRLLSLKQRDDVFASDRIASSSGELNCQSPQTAGNAGKPGHFFIGNEPFDGSDEINPCNMPSESNAAAPRVDRVSVVENARKSKIPRPVDKSLREPVHTRSVREPTVKPGQEASRKHVTGTTADGRSQKQPLTTRDATSFKIEAPEAKMKPATCHAKTCTGGSNNAESTDFRSTGETDKARITQASSDDDSDTSTSQSHHSSVTSSADESSS